MRSCSRSLLRLLSAFVVVCFVSCSSGSALVPVQGKVTLKGQPLAGAKVIFHPGADQEKGAPSDWPTGTTDSDGSFTLQTAGKAGAPEGSYRVSIVCMEAPPKKPGDAISMEMTSEEVDKLKGAYADPAQSKFKVDVKSGSNQLEPFALN